MNNETLLRTTNPEQMKNPVKLFAALGALALMLGLSSRRLRNAKPVVESWWKS